MLLCDVAAHGIFGIYQSVVRFTDLPDFEYAYAWVDFDGVHPDILVGIRELAGDLHGGLRRFCGDE